MQIILRGPAAGYEAEHTARLFFPGAEKSENLPQEGDFVLAQSNAPIWPCCASTVSSSGKPPCARRARMRSTPCAGCCMVCSAGQPASRRHGA